MKSKMKRRLLAVVLCMVIMLSNSSFIFASGGTDEAVTASQENSQQDVQDTQTETSGTSTETEVSGQSEIATLSETQETEAAPTPEATPEPTAEPTATPTPEVTAEPTAAPTPETETGEDVGTEQTSETEAIGTEVNQDPETAVTPEEVQEESATQTPQPFEGVYEDDTITISVCAEAGIVPEDAELSVTPIEKTEITEDMTEEEKAEAEKINAQYDMTEKKLTEDSEENEEVMEGFLAYDISFLVNGKEVEPSGDVKVVMEFKEAAIPEGVSEGAAVAIKHLKEDETAEDGVVVENIAEKAEVQTTDKAEVEKVELTSDSFSPYTIYWYTSYSDNLYDTIEIHYIDTDGYDLNESVDGEITYKFSDSSITLADSEYRVNIDGYRYVRAVIANDSQSAAEETTQIYRLRLRNGTIQYSESENGNGNYTNVEEGQKVYMVYGDAITADSKIRFRYVPADEISDATWNDYDDGNEYTMNYTIVLLDEDGNPIDTDSGEINGVSLDGYLDEYIKWLNNNGRDDEASEISYPNSITFDTNYLSMSSATISAFGINIPGFTFEDGYAYFYWTAHWGGNKTRVTDISNFGKESTKYGTGWYNYLGYKCYLWPESADKPDDEFYFPYTEPDYAEDELNGINTEKYLAYQPNGVLRLVFRQVSKNMAYNSNFVDAYNTSNYRLIEQIPMEMSWDSTSGQWVGNLDEVTNIIPERENYTFVGWYTDRDEEGNGTGKKIVNPEDDQTDYTSDVFYYARWEPDYNTESVNFYLNLASQILDTDGNIDSQGSSNFTTSVSGNRTDEEGSGFGIGVPINTDLLVRLPDSHIHSTVQGGNPLGVIGSSSGENAKVADELIRQLGTADGAYGNQTGQTNMWYQIVDENGDPAFPTDEEIFAYIRTYWDSPYGGVNKGQEILVNGIAIDKNNLTTDNFAIRWYVFKDHASDYWHIDGILVPKSGILNITKTFVNDKIAVLMEDNEEFAINVTGNFLTGNDTTTISNKLSDADKTVNADGTVTYSWSLAIFGESYNVEEVGYNTGLNGWEYSSTEWTYTNSDGTNSTGKTTSTTLQTERGWSDTDDGEKTQTLDLSNYYNRESENPYITVSKTFKGLSYDQIKKLSGFKITVKSTDESVEHNLTLTDSNVTVSPNVTDNTQIQDYTFTWRIENCETGTYEVTETGATVGQYQLETTGIAEDITISAETWTFTPDVSSVSGNNNTNFTIGSNKIVMASSTEGYLIWTNEQLSAAQEAAVIQSINTDEEFDTFKINAMIATAENCHFYYGNSIAEGIILGKGTITYNPPVEESAEGTLIFENTSIWMNVIKGSYTMTNAVNADIGVTNTYTANLDLKKISASTNSELTNAVFRISKLEESNWVSVQENIIVTNEVELKKLEPGVLYQLTETSAPEGYMLLTDSIYFKAIEGSIKLCNESGIVIESGSTDMWYISENGISLTIKNHLIYELPSAGGSGIYWYLMGGILFMLAGSFILYRNKRKEVLGS